MYVMHKNKSLRGTKQEALHCIERWKEWQKESAGARREQTKERQTAEVDFLFLVALW